ncbi:MAG: OST-HTH/LOTUS domain-containing protein, partial [Steroidobacteraceae bacterium]
FIYYDDLVRKDEQRRGRRKPATPAPAKPQAAATRGGAGTAVADHDAPTDASATDSPVQANGQRQRVRKKTEEDKRQEAFDLVLATIEALSDERDESDKIWGSMIKQTLKRQRPGFNESYHGFRTFNQLLEEAQARRLLELEKDEKSGGYVVKVPSGQA